MPRGESKTCSKCGERKPLEGFYPHKRWGHTSACRECTKKKVMEYRRANPEKVATWDRAHRQRNPDKERTRQREWRKLNPEKQAARCKRWRDRNPDKIKALWEGWFAENGEALRARNRENYDPERKRQSRTPDQLRRARDRRRARLFDAFVADVSFEEILLRDLGVCGICQGPIMGELHFDHIVPLAAGGTHEPENVQLAHAACNLRKSSKLDFSLENDPMQ